MNSIKIILFFILISFLGCESSEIIEPDISHEEFIVVQAQLVANEVFAGIVLTKTLPLGISYDIKKAEIKTAFAYLRKNFVQIIPLHYSEDGRYNTFHELRPRETDVFELFAEIDDDKIYSKTFIPKAPNISSALYELNSGQIIIDLIPSDEEAYGAIWQVNDPIPVKASDFFSIETLQPTEFSLTIRTLPLPEKYKNANYLNALYYQVFSFDPSYSAYFRNKGSSNAVSNPFVQGGGNTSWNITGKNAIGLFMGVNKSELRKVE